MYSMKNHYLFPAVFLAVMACQEKKAPAESTDSAPPVQESTTPKPVAAAASNALVLSEPCAVFYSPDTSKLEKLKKENGEEAFYTIADDNQNYMADSHIFVESKGLKIVDPEGGTINFRGKNGSITTINLDDAKYSWAVFLFDGNTVNKIDITDIEGEYAKYMK